MENYQKLLSDLLTNEPEGARASLVDALKPFAGHFTQIETICREVLRSDDGWVLWAFQNYLAKTSGYFRSKLEAAEIQVKRSRTIEFNDPDRWKRDARLEVNHDK